jgi:hypothetical protein
LWSKSHGILDHNPHSRRAVQFVSFTLAGSPIEPPLKPNL